MPLISVVIVNYNVKYFLRQCLQSLFQSSVSDQLEIIVVDNASVDGSADMVRTQYPTVQLIENQDNRGFSKANNQAFKMAHGEYILILNPDTLVEEKTIEDCLNALGSNSDIGAVCVKMLDGTGRYLPESKRGFPTPLRSLFKLSGLARLFPGSKIFNGYYLGHLDENSSNEIEVLTGAFAFLPSKIIHQLNGFDEDYFMYGEDIELSYQLNQLGYKILYLPESRIIHFKGESTNKSSINYLRNFYGAMHIYASKRGRTSGFIWRTILNAGILFTAIAGLFKSVSQKFVRPLIDTALLIGFGILFKMFWAKYYHRDEAYYNNDIIIFLLVAIAIVTCFCYYIFGQYDRRHNIRHLIYGFVSASLVNLSLYSLLPSDLRFSRVILLAIIVASPLLLFVTRKFYNRVFNGISSFDNIFSKRVAIIGSAASCQKISQIVRTYSAQSNIIGYILTDNHKDSLGNIEEVSDVVKSRSINELIFCSKDLSSEYIFASMTHLGRQLKYKIANDDNTGILGSDSKDKIGQWYTLDIGFKIDQVFHRRTKRLLDLCMCMALLLLMPVLILFSKQRKRILQGYVSVLIGRNSWLGYLQNDQRLHELPALRKGVFELMVSASPENSANRDPHQMNMYYARNYSIWIDIQMLIQHIF